MTLNSFYIKFMSLSLFFISIIFQFFFFLILFHFSFWPKSVSNILLSRHHYHDCLHSLKIYHIWYIRCDFYCSNENEWIEGGISWMWRILLLKIKWSFIKFYYKIIFMNIHIFYFILFIMSLLYFLTFSVNLTLTIIIFFIFSSKY